MSFIPNEYRDISFVKRWAILRRNSEQSVAEHSFYVAIYADRIASFVGWKGDYARLMRCALIHDLFEGRSGDIPAPMKKALNCSGEYGYEEERYFKEIFPHHLEDLPYLDKSMEIGAIVRVADMLEACVYLRGLAALGNHMVGNIDDLRSPLGDVFKSMEDSVKDLYSVLDIRGHPSVLKSILVLVVDQAGQAPRVLTRNGH